MKRFSFISIVWVGNYPFLLSPMFMVIYTSLLTLPNSKILPIFKVYSGCIKDVMISDFVYTASGWRGPNRAHRCLHPKQQLQDTRIEDSDG